MKEIKKMQFEEMTLQEVEEVEGGGIVLNIATQVLVRVIVRDLYNCYKNGYDEVMSNN